ncbi:hypothetical protein PPYR_12540 [Photinus pyralis]|uniref:UPAR/Ly6 domain-containing protein qvr n=1 Tax=Photinus pyralis TaxID=7054 RepID=A0A1Y1MY23_PHOPY|nr:hypothetical protein PPYR_12540 [Photinus pyralis]
MAVTFCVFLLELMLLAVLVSSESVNGALRCYHCESAITDACEDPFDSAIVASAECNSLNYSPKQRRDDEGFQSVDSELEIVDGRFRGVQVLNRILERNETIAKDNFRYVCIKVELVKDDLVSVTRTCERIGTYVKDACEFVTQKANPLVTVKSCRFCESDNCNSGRSLRSNLFATFICVGILIIKNRI